MEQELCWITGASSGIGRACALALAASGKAIVASSRDREALQSLVTEIRAAGGKASALVCDVTKEEDVTWAIKSIIQTFDEGPDVLINNAGISPYHNIEDLSVEEFDRVIDTNLIGNMLCAKAVIPEMLKKGKGTIVQMLSIASTKAFAGGSAYGASKFGALGFTNALREEVRRKGIRVISVMPGATETPTWSEAERAEFHERMMQPEDIAQAVVNAIAMPERALIEEIVIRPIGGDL